MDILRKCKKCNKEKILETSFIKYNKKMYRWTCKECFNSNINKWRHNNKELCNEYHKKWRNDNGTYFNEYMKEYKKNNYDPISKHNQYIKYYYSYV